MTRNQEPRPLDTFIHRHVGPSEPEIATMLETVGVSSLEALVDEIIPTSIRSSRPLSLGEPRGEAELLASLRKMAGKNRVFRSFIGQGYHGCMTPAVIKRNILENPGWYTPYTPYQAELAQGRLEALLLFQTMISDLSGLPLANASLLDEATAAAEAMTMCRGIGKRNGDAFFVDASAHPQTIAVLRTRADGFGIDLQVGDPFTADLTSCFGVLLQHPATDGRLRDVSPLVERAGAADCRVVMAIDPLASCLLRAPGELGADIAVGSAQRFGVPMGFGGPHAGFIAATDAFKRLIPGRVVGLSRDESGRPALRLAMQTREQHIRRDKATSNICTAQVLLANIAAMYAVYHGPEGLRAIAQRVHGRATALAGMLRDRGLAVGDLPFFDTLRIDVDDAATESIRQRAIDAGMNLRYGRGWIGVSLDETTTHSSIRDLVSALTGDASVDDAIDEQGSLGPHELRESEILRHPSFHLYHSEHEMLRFLFRLQGKDVSLADSMIPLGSCTMKLNGTSLMVPITWPEFSALHPFAPADQWMGYRQLFDDLEAWLAEITGFHSVSLQPNAGAQGEYAGLLAIRRYHDERGDNDRDVCLIPKSAHGTNPASAVMASMRVVAVECDEQGNVNIADLAEKAERHAEHLAALMVTYPSTHGVFETDIKEICAVVHRHGGMVYMDGANMNAQVGFCRPGEIGADVCHLNLHKTFCIPHGGGGPGVGPIGVVESLVPYLPEHPHLNGDDAHGTVAAAPFGSSMILPISWVYIALMGREGLERATQVAMLNANYMATRLSQHYPIVYTGPND
ncbi:MAG: aminomethyl-transferring glycine dehydrogenase, partial [Acidobacteriota bacterium]|nr:aminomethyl-transferring glycine dehydrogenase [Acidobacteriota bacterium]